LRDSEKTPANGAPTATHPRWTRIERVVAGLTIVNAALGLLMWLRVGGAIGALPLLSLLGLLSGLIAWRGRPGGHAAGLAFYAFQLAGYHRYDLTYAYPLRGSVSLAFVVHLPAGVLIVNVLAVAMFAASVALLWRRLREGRAGTKTEPAHSTYQ
jgi:hypothetical protein